MTFIKQTFTYLFCALFLSACIVKQAPVMTHRAKVNLSPAQYALFWESLDKEMLPFGLVRTGADAGLNHLYKRDVLFGVYHVSGDDTLWFLTAHDIGKVGVIEFNIYAKTIKDEGAQLIVLERVRSVIAKYGSKLEQA
jgi:hypothetical protein